MIPDSFKGNISSSEICSIMRKSIYAHYPDAEVVSIPVADGGEGSVDCFLAALGGEKVRLFAAGPLFKDVEAFYGILPDGTAIVEMAACAGLPLVEGRLSPGETTTYGMGQVIAHALKSGCKKAIVGLGGSATNDGGAGCAAALGARFFDGSNNPFVPTGLTLHKIERVDLSGLLPRLRETKLVTMCDIDNPLCGANGAAHVFAPQKGADRDMVELLDAGLRHMAHVVRRDLGFDILDMPGAGAAGGMGGGMVAFLGSSLQMGIETVLDAVGFDRLLQGADLVISGEGKIDSQSLGGKVVIGVSRRSKLANVPVVAVVGDIGDNIGDVYEQGVAGVFSINRVAKPFSEQRKRSKNDLALTVDNLMRFIKCMEGGCG